MIILYLLQCLHSPDSLAIGLESKPDEKEYYDKCA